jgi:Fic family protein
MDGEKPSYQPPYTMLVEQNLTPRLRRENRIRTIQASLAIENNTLTLEQVTAVIEGKRVLGHPREIRRCATPLPPTRPWLPIK